MLRPRFLTFPFLSYLAAFRRHPLCCLPGDGLGDGVGDESASRLRENPLGGGGAGVGGGGGLQGVALHGHRGLGRRRAGGVPARLAGWNGSSVVGRLLFGIQISGTYWSLRYGVGLGVGQQRQSVLGPGALVGRVRLEM